MAMQRRYLHLADTQINTEDHGGEGPPVLLVHGLGGSAGIERPDIVVRETLRRMNVPERPGGRGFSGEFGHFYPSAAGTLA